MPPRPSPSPLVGDWEPVTPEEAGAWEPIGPDDAAQEAAAPESPGMLGTLRDLFAHLAESATRKKGESLSDFMSRDPSVEAAKALGSGWVGAGKGAGSTALGLGSLVRQGAGAALDKVGPEGASHALGLDAGTHNVASDLGLDPEGLAEKVGFGAEQLAEFFGPAAAKAPKLVAAGGKLGTLASMGIEGANSAAVAAAQGGDPALAGILGAAGPFAGKVAGKVSPKVAAWLSGLARKGYGKALGATTEAAKASAQEVVPELLKRGLTAMTREGLANKVGERSAAANANLVAETARVPIGTQADLGKVVRELESLKLEHMVSGPGGTMIPANAEAEATIAKINSLQEHIRATDPQFHNVAKQRRILDAQVTQGGKQPFGRSIDDASTLGITKEGANLERAALGVKSVPVANANREVSLWLDTAKLLEKDPVEKAAGAGARAVAKALTQYGTRGLLVGGAAAAGGKAAALTAGAIAAHDAVRALVQSTGWRTVSAVNKARLADLIARQDAEGITRLVGRLTSGMSSQLSREKQKREYFYKLRQSEKKPPEANR